MDLDSVAGGVLYPSQGLTLYRVPDSQLLSAILRAYNDWLADFCTPYPQRLKGIAMLNVDDVADAQNSTNYGRHRFALHCRDDRAGW